MYLLLFYLNLRRLSAVDLKRDKKEKYKEQNDLKFKLWIK